MAMGWVPSSSLGSSVWATSHGSQNVRLHSTSTMSSAVIRTMWESFVHVRQGRTGGKERRGGEKWWIWEGGSEGEGEGE